MYYFTKEYENKKKYLGCLEDYTPIEDKDYDEEMIQNLYQKKLQERIEKAKKDFNTPIQMMKTREEVIKTYNEKDYPKYDLASKRAVGYQTLEEVLKAYDYQKQKQELLFASRGEFDSKKIEKIFLEQYEERKRENLFSLPYQYRKKVNPSLLALYLIPKSVYDEMKEYLKECEGFIQKTNSEYEKDYDNIKDKFSFEELDLMKKNFTPLIGLISREDELTLLFHFEGLRSPSSTGYSSYVFSNYMIRDKDEDVSLVSSFVRQRNYPDYFLVKEKELSIVENQKVISLLLERHSDRTLSEISFSFEKATINKNV